MQRCRAGITRPVPFSERGEVFPRWRGRLGDTPTGPLNAAHESLGDGYGPGPRTSSALTRSLRPAQAWRHECTARIERLVVARLIERLVVARLIAAARVRCPATRPVRHGALG